MTTETLSVRSDPARKSGTAVVRRVDLDEPIDWLAAGTRDLVAAPAAGLLYGALFSLAAGAALYLAWESPGFFVALLTGLLLVGPFLAAGLYVGARQRERGEPVSIRAGLAHLASRATNLGLFALFLTLVAAAWVRLSALLFAIKFNTLSPSVEGYLGILSGAGDPVALAYFVLIGAVLAVTVFVTSAVAIPLIVDRDASPLAAIQASVQAVSRNRATMTLWAALIVALAGVGILTFFLAMVAIFPVIGFASWHAYRRLVA